MRKKTKIFVGACVLSMLMTGCGAKTAEESNIETNIDTLVTGSVAEASESTQNGPENFAQMNPEGQYQGKITEIDGSRVTVALAQMPGRGEMPEGGMPAGGEKPEGEIPTGEMPEGEMPAGDRKPEGEIPTGGDKPEGVILEGAEPEGNLAENGGRPDGMQRGDMSRMELTLTGETMTIEITEDTTITVNGEEATLEELKGDATVIFIMDGDTVQSIMVMGI